eukprot:7613146-Pyramimonas_sp.AAC.1
MPKASTWSKRSFAAGSGPRIERGRLVIIRRVAARCAGSQILLPIGLTFVPAPRFRRLGLVRG